MYIIKIIMVNWEIETENILKYVFIDKLSYNEIGRKYGCTGANIKRGLKRRGYTLPVKSKNQGKTPHNKGKKKINFCLNCNKRLKTNHPFCSNTCQHEYNYKQRIKEYKEDNTIAKNTQWGADTFIFKTIYF